MTLIWLSRSSTLRRPPTIHMWLAEIMTTPGRHTPLLWTFWKSCIWIDHKGKRLKQSWRWSQGGCRCCKCTTMIPTKSVRQGVRSRLRPAAGGLRLATEIIRGARMGLATASRSPGRAIVRLAMEVGLRAGMGGIDRSVYFPQSCRSILSFSFASASVCNCMFSETSGPARQQNNMIDHVTG